MQVDEQVDILMGTYNGAPYVVEQIRSLQAQTYAHWRLLVRDDGSRDQTVAVLHDLAASDARVCVVTDTLGNLGFNRNFHRLLGLSTAPFSMYCDQDDVWLPEKIEATLVLMKQALAEHPDQPVLVHCDSQVADSDLRPLAQTFTGRRARHLGLSTVLMANPAQGATIMLNAPLRALALLAEPVLPFDFHAALIAEAAGERRFLPRSLVLYRQHARNAIGAGGGAGQAGAAGDTGSVSPTLRLGLQAADAIEQTLRVVQAHWRPGVADILKQHRAFVQPGGSWRKLWWACRANYQFYRRIDRINALLYAVGLPSLKRP